MLVSGRTTQAPLILFTSGVLGRREVSGRRVLPTGRAVIEAWLLAARYSTASLSRAAHPP